MTTTTVTGHVRAPRAAVFRALVDPAAIAVWRVPDGMSAQVHEFDARPGGRIRVTLAYDGAGVGKTSVDTDTYAGHVASVVTDREVVEVLGFETPASETAGPAVTMTMTMTTTLHDAEGGTDVVVVHDGLPDAVSPADNEAGTRMALDRLAALVESGGVADPG